MRKVLLSAATLFMSMLFGVSAFAADIDKTDKVGTSKEAWNATGGPVNIDGISMPEKYETTTATLGDVMWQTVEGLDNGTYTVELWANARYTAGRGFESAATDGQLECTFLFANNVEISIPVVFNPDLNNNTSHVLEGVEVTDGTLKMGMTKKADGSNWHTIQIKALTLHASDDAALASAKADLQAAIDAAAAVSPATEALTAAIAAAQGVLETATTPEEVLAAVAPLQAATVLAVNTNAVAGATVAAPVVTNFVVNGTFDSTTAPWKCTTGAQNQALASNQTGAFTGNFFENWNPNNYTGKIYQVIENIPNGLYELSICAFANVFDGTAQYVYANADKTYLVAGAPTAYTVRTTVTDNKIEVGLEQTAAVNNWMGIDNVSLKYFGEVSGDYALELYKSTKAAAEALLGEKMAPEAKAALEAALAAEVDETSEEALIAAEAALQEAITAANVSINLYASNKAAIDAMFALMNSTNVYTAEAFAAYSAKAEDFLAQYEAGTLTATVDNPAAIHGWHAVVDYDDLLLSAFGVKDFDTDLYINTWSTEGETDGSEFKVPFFEYWTGDDQSLAATTKTATVTGLEAGKKYEVSAWIRTRAKNGVAAVDATGITLSVGAGESVDVTEGAVVGESQFAHAVYAAVGTANRKGELTINFNVAADNNVSWLSFKNIKYAEYDSSKDDFMAAAMALASLTETMPSIWTIPAVSNKFMAVQEKAFGMVDTLDLVPVDTLVYYTGLMNETAAFAQAMDAEFNEWKALLYTCYDYQDNSTADEAAVAAFAAVVDVHMGYQYSMPATTVAELEALISELKDASIAYALSATANEGFGFAVSPWTGGVVENGKTYYIYNVKTQTFLTGANSWGTQASLGKDGLPFIAEGDSLYALNGVVSNGGASHYLGNGGYIDAAAFNFTLTQVTAGIYTIGWEGNYYASQAGSTVVATVQEVGPACYWQFLTAEDIYADMAKATVEAPYNVTPLLACANFGRNNLDISKWQGEPARGGDNTNMCAEAFSKNFDVYQTITVPNGLYKVSAQGFYRMGSYDTAADTLEAGCTTTNAVFYANEKSVAFPNIFDDAASVTSGVDVVGYGKVPNSMTDASVAFSAGLYQMETIEVVVLNGQLTIGFKKDNTVTNDWSIFDNVQIQYCGSDLTADMVGSVDPATLPSTQLFAIMNVAGNNFLTATSGITIEARDEKNADQAFYFVPTDSANVYHLKTYSGKYVKSAVGNNWTMSAVTELEGDHTSHAVVAVEEGVFTLAMLNAPKAGSIIGTDNLTNGSATYSDKSIANNGKWFIIPVSYDITSALQAIIDAAKLIEGVMGKAESAELAAAITAAEGAIAIELPDTVAGATTRLNAAVAAAEASLTLYAGASVAIEQGNAMLFETANGYDDLAEVVELAEIFYADGNLTVEILDELNAAVVAYIAANADKETEGLVNGTFGDASAASTEGWTQVGGEMGKTGNHNKWLNVNDGFFEQWKNTLPDVEIYQEISGLPAGTYTFAAYVVACQQSKPDSYEVSGVTVYANDKAIPVHTINVDRDETNRAIGAELACVTVTIADGETLKVGMKVASTDANWVVIDNAKLYNFESLTGIENIEAIENNAIYTITGKRVQGILEKGLYIVNGKKVLVK
ncbi:MAG: hypothetical protein IJA98_00100 [Bacteroidaceae bacterium]|nr:hypothetical protein [Bacteroidaceae bacterium]